MTKEKRDPIPDIDWWDMPLLQSVERCLAREKDRQEMIRQGLIEPPKPKVKMSNLMKVLCSEATQDPTRLEMGIRSEAVLNTCFKVDVNAQENRLCGCAVIYDGISVAIVEGGNKPIKSMQGELWGWTCFYVGVAAVAFGSAYYHLKPNDARLVWDRLPMTIAFTSVMSIFIIERIDERKGTISLIPLLMAGIISILYWRQAHYLFLWFKLYRVVISNKLSICYVCFFDDLRPYALIQFVPCIAIPVMAILLPPMYTHSSYWLWAAVFYLLAKVEEAADKVIYEWTHHIVSGHTLKHLCAAMVPVFLTLMLAKRSIQTERQSLLQTWRVSWTKFKENGSRVESYTCSYSTVPVVESP
ncbi:protein rdm16 [Quercus suber]|uniref:Protein rdm16 n=1 Tax=Quercus suber TaxID=58331 RepID=A0AAW0KZ88_QUESU